MLGVAVASTNSVIVVFDVPPNAFDVQAYFSASNTGNYAFSASLAPPPPYLPATRQPLVANAIRDPDYTTQVELLADVSLEPLTLVTVTIDPAIQGESGETFAGPTSWTVGTVAFPDDAQTALEAQQDTYQDLEYVIVGPAGTETQVYGFQSNDDLAIQSGAASLQKRIYRRLFSRPGDYAWDAQYGVGVAVKALARGGRLQERASSVAEQIRREPDVANASAEVRLDRRETGTFVLIDVAVVRADQAIVKFGLSEPL